MVLEVEEVEKCVRVHHIKWVITRDTQVLITPHRNNNINTNTTNTNTDTNTTNTTNTTKNTLPLVMCLRDRGR